MIWDNGKLVTTIVYWFYGDDAKENGSYYSILGCLGFGGLGFTG